MTTRTVLNWLVILVLLLVVPHESRFFRIDSDPGDWYGEIHLKSLDQSLVIAKNSGSTVVDPQLEDVELMALKQENGKPKIQRSPEKVESIPVSLSVFYGGRRSSETVIIDGKFHVAPQDLSIFTRSDLKLVYMLGAALLGLFMLLGFILAEYSPGIVLGQGDKSTGS